MVPRTTGLPGMDSIDCGLSMQNFLLACKHKGLATVPIGFARLASQEIVEELDKVGARAGEMRLVLR